MLVTQSISSIHSMWEVLVLFLIPIGGGIPAGVLLAKVRGIDWPITTVLYFISDIILACVFEPVMLMVIRAGKNSPKFAKINEALKASSSKMILQYGVNPGPFTLVLLSFGIDPMTGRVVAHAAGHKFLAGWTIAIAGDMITFAILMSSTLWLSQYLGDGTWTIILITGCMFIIPGAIRKLRERFRKPADQDLQVSKSVDHEPAVLPAKTSARK